MGGTRIWPQSGRRPVTAGNPMITGIPGRTGEQMFKITIRTRWLLVPLAALGLAACGQAVSGSPAPNPEAARQAADRTLDQGVAAMGKYVQTSANFRGTVFRYATIDDKGSGSEVEVSRMGQPAAVMTKIHSTSHSGFDYDVFHPAGSALDYVRLGPGYAKLAPTKWVSMAAFSASDFSCAMPGLQTLCKLTDTIDATRKAAPPGLSTETRRLDDGGTDIETSITLKAFLDATVIPIPADITTRIDPDMTGKLIPVRLTLNSDGTFRRIEVNGAVLGKAGKVQLQVGYETKGPSASDDYPPVPQPAEVTALPDKAAVDDFWARLGQIRG
ncbi:hypothetical protein [Actinocrispum sp. NPDC049592]|uniref:hypothetical protein n=1 Tax=Actinocrispum sp. NPDC049592 TaxID=3154835 RepID=UPI0034397AD1